VIPASPSFCGVPAWGEGDRARIVIAGVPTDVGGFTHSRSQRSAPAVLRRASSLFPLRLDDAAQPLGWYDYTQLRAILPAVSIADAGDFSIDKHHASVSLASVSTQLQVLADSSELLLILGGDHSITHWTIDALSGDVDLLFIDAHEDATGLDGDLPHCGNVVNYLEQKAHVKTITQFGLRGLVPNNRIAPGVNRQICASPASLIASLGASELDLFISIDVDVFDPTMFRSVAAPSPLGMHPDDLLDTLRAVSALGRRVRVLELVEFAPGAADDPMVGMAIVQFILRAMDILLPAGQEK
jgi:arginase family enzyme